MHADLDTCTEVDIISIRYAREQTLRLVHPPAPVLRAVGELKVPSYRVYKVPLTITDSRGTQKRFEQLYVAIDRDFRQEGSPILLSRTTLNDHRIYLAPFKDQ